MPTFELTAPDGKTYEVEGPEGATKEQAFQKLQQQLKSAPPAAAKAAPTPSIANPEASQIPTGGGGGGPTAAKPQERTGMDTIGHQLGLGARYALETIASPATGAVDAVRGFMGGANALASGNAKMPAFEGSADQLRKGLIDMGFPSAENKAEKRGEVVAEIAPALLGAGALARTAVKGISESAKAGKIKQLTDMFTGAGVKDAAAKAEAAVAKEAERAVAATKKSGLEAMAEARQTERVAGEAAQERQRIEGLLAKPKPETQSLGETGQILESSFKSTLAKGAAHRAEVGNKDFAAAEKAAEAKEAAGQFVDTSAAFKHVDELLAHVKDVPELQKKVETMARMLHGDNKKPVTLVVDQYGKPLAVDKSGAEKTFKNLEVTRRYLNDIGYGADLEGFPGIARRAARDAVKELDVAMGNFTPEFRTYKDNWKKLSEPLETQGTRLGQAIYGSEGGIDGKAYSKLADKDIPGKVFANKEQLGLFTDALAGGKGATPAARAEASKTVQKLALKYFEEQTSNMAPKAAKAFVESPKQRDLMEALPNVKNVIGGRAQGELSKTAKVESLIKQQETAAKAAEAQRKQASKLMETRRDLNEKLFRADTMAQQGSDKARAKALTQYTEILGKARDAGGVSDDTYKSMVNMLDNIPSTEEKVVFMHKIANRAAWLIGGGGLVIGAETGRRMLK